MKQFESEIVSKNRMRQFSVILKYDQCRYCGMKVKDIKAHIEHHKSWSK